MSAKYTLLSRKEYERIRNKSSAKPVRPEEDKPIQQPQIEPIRKKSLPRAFKPDSRERVVMDRAEAAKEEDLIEVRQANRIILAAKCHLIRNAQIVERNELKREVSVEDARYDDIMEKDRKEFFQREAQVLEERQRANKEHAEFIKTQLELRENERRKEADRIKNEAEALMRLQHALKISEAESQKEKQQRKEKLQKELQRSFDLNEAMKAINFERESISEMRIQEYMRLKIKRAEELELEKRLKEEERERKLLKMSQVQKQTQNIQDSKFAQWVHREQELKEREYRQKEKEALIKKKELESAILQERKLQQEEKKRIHDEEVSRAQKEYEISLKKFNEEWDKEKTIEAKRLRQKEAYCQLIKDQMKIKEEQAKVDREKSRKELEELKAQDQQRQGKIDEILQKKLRALKQSQVPENLLKDVERRMKRSA